MAESLVERRIHFFRANLGVDDDFKPIALDVAALRAGVSRLRWNFDERYLEHKTGNFTYAHVPTTDNSLILGLSRRTDLPQQETGGQTSPLPISTNSGVAEVTHFRFFAHNIVACEYNHFGPRASRLEDYMRRRVHEIPNFTLEPLLNQEVQDRLKNMKEISCVSLKMTASTAAAWVGEADSLADAFQRLEETGKTDAIELVLKAPRKSSLGADWLKRLKNFVSEPSLLEQTDRLVAKGVLESGKLETIDLLSDKLISKQKVARISDKSRAVETNHMLQAMLDAFNELEPQLVRAASLSISEPQDVE